MEVEVHTEESLLTAHLDDFDDGVDGIGESLVGFAEGVEHGEIGIDVEQTLVVDDQQGVYFFGDARHTVESFVNLLGHLELEGNGDNAHCEDA